MKAEEELVSEVKRGSLSEKEPKPVARARPVPLPDMPLSSRRYYPGYMSGNEWFRDEMRQADVVESIVRHAPAARAEKKERKQEEKTEQKDH